MIQLIPQIVIAIAAIALCLWFFVYGERFFRNQKNLTVAFRYGKMGLPFDLNCYGKTSLSEEDLKASYLQGAESKGYADGVVRLNLHNLNMEEVFIDESYKEAYLKGYSKGVESGVNNTTQYEN